MGFQNKARSLRIADVPNRYVFIVFLAFMCAAAVYSFALPDSFTALINGMLPGTGTVSTQVIYGCVFLLICVCTASVSAAGRVSVPLFALGAGIYCSAISGAIMPDADGLAEIMPLAVFMFCFIFAFQLISARAMALSAECCGRSMADRRIKSGLISVLIMLLVLSVPMLASFIIFYRSL